MLFNMQHAEHQARQRKRKNYIDAWIAYRGIKPGAVLDATGAGKDLAWRWRKKDNFPTEEYLSALLNLLQTDRESLFLPPPGRAGEGKSTGFQSVVTEIDIPERPLSGKVGAGGRLVDVEEDGGQGLRHIPIVAGDPIALAEIAGQSLGRFEGWYAIVGHRGPFQEDLYGQLCVVGTREGETLIKWVEKSRKKGVRLISGDDSVHADGVELIWAAPVIGIRPK